MNRLSLWNPLPAWSQWTGTWLLWFLHIWPQQDPSSSLAPTYAAVPCLRSAGSCSPGRSLGDLAIPSSCLVKPCETIHLCTILISHLATSLLFSTFLMLTNLFVGSHQHPGDGGCWWCQTVDPIYTMITQCNMHRWALTVSRVAPRPVQLGEVDQIRRPAG